MSKNKGKLLIVAIILIALSVSIIHPFAISTPEETSITYCRSADEGRLLLNWNVVNVDGYELLLAQNNRFTRKPQTLIYSGDKRKASLVNLEKNIVYYVKIRTFNEENGEKIYSNWSNVQSVRIHAHNYTRTMTTKATCQKEGVYTYVCAECKDYYKLPAPKTDHKYVWKNNGNDTMSYVCEYCGDVKETANCNYTKTNDVPSTCKEQGYIEYTCNDCGNVKKELKDYADHDFELIKENGNQKTYECKVCGKQKLVVLAEQTKDNTTSNTKNDNTTSTTDNQTVKDETYTIDLGNNKTTTVVGHFDTSKSDELFEMLNKYRVENGKTELKRGGDALQNAANIRATEITYLFDHKRPNGERALISFTGSTGCCAENLGRYQTSTTQVMDGWKNSTSHNSNMLSKYPQSVSISVFAKYERTVGTQKVYSYHFVQFFGW